VSASARKLERLLNLTALLLAAPRAVPAEDIQSQLDYPEDQTAFRRAFERDKDELRSMGIPIKIERVLGRVPEVDGYRIPRDEYALRDPGLTPDELAALHLAASAVQVEGLEARPGLLKLGGLVDDSAAAAGVGVQVAALPADANLAALFAAVQARTTIELSYRDEVRTIDPHRLEFLRGRWYLTGFDHDRSADRNFRLDRIDGAVAAVAGATFERPVSSGVGAARQAWQYGGDDPITATLRIDATRAAWAVQHLGPDHIVESEDDGSVVVQLPVTNRDAFRSFVLTFLDHAEIVGPAELRADLVDWLTAVSR
jgi:proteasome accessory factor B